MSKVLDITRKGTWALGVNIKIYNNTILLMIFQDIIKILLFQCVAITSCLGRNDYNVVFSILTLMILTNFYNQSPKITTKIIFQIFAILALADIIWIIYFSGAWTHLSKEEREKNNNNDSEDIISFWDSLWLIHGFVYFLAYIELILKILLLYYLFTDYNGKYIWKDLFNLNYDGSNMDKQTPSEDQNQLNNISNNIDNFQKEIGTNSLDDFHNEYE